DALTVELALVEMLGHRCAQIRQLFRKLDESVVLGLLLCRAIVRVVEVLLPVGLVRAGRLQLRPGTRRDPDVSPRGRNRKLRDPVELRRIADLTTMLVVVAKRSLASLPSPPHA